MELSTRRTAITVAAVLSLVLWPVQISTLLDLPAHPLILHVPVVFVPLLGLAVLVALAKPSWFGIPLATFAVVTLAATLLTVGAGEAFLETQPKLQGNPMMKDHEGAGETVRFCMALLTAALVALLYVSQKAAATTIKVLAVILALSAAGFTVRAGHLGAKLAWGDEQRLTESSK